MPTKPLYVSYISAKCSRLRHQNASGVLQMRGKHERRAKLSDGPMPKMVKRHGDSHMLILGIKHYSFVKILPPCKVSIPERRSKLLFSLERSTRTTV